jgi:hypothetical protein
MNKNRKTPRQILQEKHLIVVMLGFDPTSRVNETELDGSKCSEKRIERAPILETYNITRKTPVIRTTTRNFISPRFDLKED